MEGPKEGRAGFGGQSLFVHVMGESELVGERSRPVPPPVCGGAALTRVLNRAFSKATFTHLGNIDEYGTTIFNGMQLGEAMPELERLREFASSQSERDVVEELIQVVTQVRRRVHTFVVFCGD